MDWCDVVDSMDQGCCGSKGTVFTSSTADLDPSLLTGTWHMTHTCNAYWNDHKNIQMVFGTPSGGPGTRPSWSDNAVYWSKKDNKRHEIVGVDTRDAKFPSLLHWTGSGKFRLICATWQLIAHDAEWTWFAAYTSPTCMTSAAVDVSELNM